MPVSTVTNGSMNGHGRESLSELKKGQAQVQEADGPGGSRYWGKRYIPNQDETFEVSHRTQRDVDQELTRRIGGQDALRQAHP